MTIRINVGGREFSVELDRADSRWKCADPPGEAAFPLAAVVAGRRYELYSDGTFAAVEN
jgi:hypothetical protein